MSSSTCIIIQKNWRLKALSAIIVSSDYGSCPTIAEIEHSVMTGQCLSKIIELEKIKIQNVKERKKL